MLVGEAVWSEFKVRVTRELLMVRIMVNGEYLKLEAFLKNNTVYAPVRAVAEALGANVQWDDPNRTVIITSSEKGLV